jgi:hypothetical protein
MSFMRGLQTGLRALRQAGCRSWQRVRGQAQVYGSSVAQARELLLKVKSSGGICWIFISDGHDISRLPK